MKRVSRTDLDAQLSRIDIDSLSENDQRALLVELEELDHEESRAAASGDFLSFVRYMWPGFIAGHHHTVMANAFDRVLNGECNRLIINMPPRHTKSEFASVHLPAYFIGRFPDKKIIEATHTVDLALDFGRKAKNLISTPEFAEVFPGVELAADSKAAGKWATNKFGEYFAVGIRGAVAGKGADLFVIDDVVDEQTGIEGETNPDVYEKIYDWYTLVRQRLQPGAAIIIVMTRWSKRDLTGKLVKNMMQRPEADQWEVIELPALMPSGKQMFPEYWPLDELMATKNSIPLHRWNAQYQQNPTSQTSAILKRDKWRRWTNDDPPKCDIILQSWDTAFEKTERSNYSALTEWGIFKREDDDSGKTVRNIILLDAFRKKMEFPELKKVVKQRYKDRKPDIVLIEKKSSGAPLIAELRMANIPVESFTPTRGNDKIARANQVTDMFHSGYVWAPETKWAEEVIEECNDFPAGDSDDWVDTVTQALIRFRKGGFIELPADDDDDEPVRYHRQREYY